LSRSIGQIAFGVVGGIVGGPRNYPLRGTFQYGLLHLGQMRMTCVPTLGSQRCPQRRQVWTSWGAFSLLITVIFLLVSYLLDYTYKVVTSRGLIMMPQNIHRLTAEKEQEICRRYQAGESSYRLAQDVGFSKPTILKVLKRHGVTVRQHGLPFALHKVCADCGIEKPADDFYKKSNTPGWLDRRCKPCRIQYSARYKATNRDKVRLWSRQSYNRRDKAKVREAGRQWYRNNPDKSKLKKYRRRAHQAAHSGTFTQKEWQSICTSYGNVCLCCGHTAKLEIDHIIPLSRVGTSNDVRNLQPLCKSCNSGKCDRVIDFRPDRSSLLLHLIPLSALSERV
jgi:5-methylcytosine-specific restriction endonuclease McrA